MPARTQGSSSFHWPACTTTGSPTATFVTSEPTAYTIPEASEPTMWKSVGSPQRACPFVTSIGIPRAAQTLLKFTPAAITATRASCGPSSGTSITSSWIADAGSPKRSGRTSCACICAGTSPIGGSSPISYRSLPIVLTLFEGRATRVDPTVGGTLASHPRGRRRPGEPGLRVPMGEMGQTGIGGRPPPPPRLGRNEAAMSSCVKAPDVSPVVAYR